MPGNGDAAYCFVCSVPPRAASELISRRIRGIGVTPRHQFYPSGRRVDRLAPPESGREVVVLRVRSVCNTHTTRGGVGGWGGSNRSDLICSRGFGKDVLCGRLRPSRRSLPPYRGVVVTACAHARVYVRMDVSACVCASAHACVRV